ncbi:MAG TPA: DUF4062 domain-containing protein, partial [Acidimicrobiales bacterium]|nr:DUF4062 domain-containing protein [Acidimicrobiales bacterium]
MVGVFISSARGYIDRYRNTAIEVCQRLGLTPVAMEEMRPESSAALDVCRRMIAGAEAFVAIVGYAFGSVPGDDGLCFTELEIRHAAELGLALHVFIVDPKQPWDPSEVGSAESTAVEEMKQRLADTHTTRPFTTVESFREDLLLTLLDYARPLRDEPSERAHVRPPTLSAHPPYVMRQTFTGRTADLAAILDWSDSDDAVMVIDGIGGLGKSALTWTWTEHEAPTAIASLAGRFWWSFYEGSAQISRFVQDALGYIVGDELDDVAAEEQFARLLDELRLRPYLLVLDGFERMLNAYHRVDPSKLRDDEVDTKARGLIDAGAAHFLSLLASCSPSKVLIGTRLMPSDLEGPSGSPLPGVRRYRLPDLGSDDAALIVNRLDVRGERRSIRGFFEPLGNHPLVIGVVCGMIRDYRKAPGDFDAWLADPSAGGAFHFAELPLTQKHAHVLEVALDRLTPDQEQLLGWLSVLSMAVRYETVAAINPFAPPRPIRPKRSLGFLDEWLAKNRSAFEGREYVPPSEDDEQTEEERHYEEELADWEASNEVRLAPVRLDRALADLEDRGLLWWDRRANTYDVHPVVRAYAHDRLDDEQRVAANKRVRDHFTALPPEDADRATSVEDLERSITIFRATLGAGDAAHARRTFKSRGLDRLNQLGAYPTVIELLHPVVDQSSDDTRLLQNLAYARQRTGSFDEAIALTSRRLKVHLRGRGSLRSTCLYVLETIAVLADCYRQHNQLARATKTMNLAAELDDLFEAPQSHAYMEEWAFIRSNTGDLDAAKQAIRKLLARGPSGDCRNLAILELSIDFRQGVDITSALAHLDAMSLPSPEMRRNLLHLRADHAVASGDYESATQWASELLRERRASGMRSDDVVAGLALIRMKAGAVDEARQLIDQVTEPSVAYARVAWQLDRDDAHALALASYEDAWGDGPPFAASAELKEATELLEEMDIPLPSLPTTDPNAITIPHEPELRAFVERI